MGRVVSLPRRGGTATHASAAPRPVAVGDLAPRRRGSPGRRAPRSGGPAVAAADADAVADVPTGRRAAASRWLAGTRVRLGGPTAALRALRLPDHVRGAWHPA